MASILNTDLGELYSQWGERVAFNEGYQKQKITSARQAGVNAFNDGLDVYAARDNYFASQKQKSAEAKEFLNSEPDDIAQDAAADAVHDDEQMNERGSILDGEQTLGMESVVVAESLDLVDEWRLA